MIDNVIALLDVANDLLSDMLEHYGDFENYSFDAKNRPQILSSQLCAVLFVLKEAQREAVRQTL